MAAQYSKEYLGLSWIPAATVVKNGRNYTITTTLTGTVTVTASRGGPPGVAGSWLHAILNSNLGGQVVVYWWAT